VKTIAARLWRAMAGPLQWRILWVRHAKFMVGVTGIVRDPDGNVLLLKHRFWPGNRPWGLPSERSLTGASRGVGARRLGRRRGAGGRGGDRLRHGDDGQP
jgi:hypothetical protein